MELHAPLTEKSGITSLGEVPPRGLSFFERHMQDIRQLGCTLHALSRFRDSSQANKNVHFNDLGDQLTSQVQTITKEMGIDLDAFVSKPELWKLLTPIADAYLPELATIVGMPLTHVYKKPSKQIPSFQDAVHGFCYSASVHNWVIQKGVPSDERRKELEKTYGKSIDAICGPQAMEAIVKSASMGNPFFSFLAESDEMFPTKLWRYEFRQIEASVHNSLSYEYGVLYRKNFKNEDVRVCISDLDTVGNFYLLPKCKTPEEYVQESKGSYRACAFLKKQQVLSYCEAFFPE